MREHTGQGYTNAAEADLPKYFDTRSRELPVNLLRKQIQDKRVTDLVKKYLKSGSYGRRSGMPNEEGTARGGSFSPLRAHICLNEFDG